MLSHLRLLSIALILTASGLLAGIGSASAELLPGTLVAPGAQHALVSGLLAHEHLAATPACSDRGCAAVCSACCLSASGPGCCGFGAVCSEAPMPSRDAAWRAFAAIPAAFALSGINPDAAQRPPQHLA